MKKRTTTVRIRSEGTIEPVQPDGKGAALSVGAIPRMTAAQIEAAAESDADNPPLTAAQLAGMGRVPRVKTLRRALGLTQEEFAARYRIPLGTLRDWEQGRTEPDLTAQAYIIVIAHDPEGVRSTLREVGKKSRLPGRHRPAG